MIQLDYDPTDRRDPPPLPLWRRILLWFIDPRPQMLDGTMFGAGGAGSRQRMTPRQRAEHRAMLIECREMIDAAERRGRGERGEALERKDSR